MKKEVSQNEFRKYYLSEFELYDGEAFITFLRVQLGSSWRREQDLNLRYLSVYPLSKRAHSTALTSLHSR